MPRHININHDSIQNAESTYPLVGMKIGDWQNINASLTETHADEPVGAGVGPVYVGARLTGHADRVSPCTALGAAYQGGFQTHRQANRRIAPCELSGGERRLGFIRRCDRVQYLQAERKPEEEERRAAN